MSQTIPTDASATSRIPWSVVEDEFFARTDLQAANVVWADSGDDVERLLRVDPRKYPAFWAWNQVRRLPGQVVAALALGSVFLADGFVQLVG
jgi:hypothetical protein